MVTADRIAVLRRPDELSNFQASEAIEGPCPTFVCFGASWPVDCCSRSRPELAHFPPRLLISRQVHLGS
jgi:hypothetical protein